MHLCALRPLLRCSCFTACFHSCARRSLPLAPAPPLTAEKFSPEFLEDRRPRLQRFLRTVALHPEMGQKDGVLSRWVLDAGPAHPAPPSNPARLGLKLPTLPGLPNLPSLPSLGRRDDSTT